MLCPYPYPVNPKLLRNLIVGNIAVYTVIAALIAYAYFFPSTPTTLASSGSTYGNNAPLISIMLPTPTPFAAPPQVSAPAGVQTVVPLETPIPVTPTYRVVTAVPTKVITVRDNGLVPPDNINIILLGTDKRPGEINWRTDTMILLTIDQVNKTVGMLTIPRDLYVNIPGIGMQRINTADFYGEYYHYPGGGPNLVKTTIEQNLGIHVHYFVRGGFDAFRKAVDILGGVDIAVDCPLYEEGFSDEYGTMTLNFQPGLQTMNGIIALRYARSRYTTNDYDRGRRQRQVLLAMWDKATSLNLLPKWPDLYKDMSDSIQTDLSPTDLATLAYIGTQLKMDKIKSRAIDNKTTTPYVTPEGAQVLLPNMEKIHSLLVEFFSPFGDDVDEAEVENAKVGIMSGIPGASDIAATMLKRNGMNVSVDAENIPIAPTTTIVMYKNDPVTAQRLANLLRLDPSSSIQTVTGGSSPYDIVVNLGRNYNSCQK